MCLISVVNVLYIYILMLISTFLWIFNNCWSATRTYVKRFFVACFLSFFELISTNSIYLFCATIPPTPIIWNSRVYIKIHHKLKILILRSNHPEIFLEKGVLEIRSKFTGERPCRRTISIKLQCSPVNLLHIFRTPFSRNTSGRLLLNTHVVLMRSVKTLDKYQAEHLTWTWQNDVC